MPRCMDNRWVLPLVAVFISLTICFLDTVSAQECQLNCKTKNCTVEGVCICDLPSEASIQAGNRTFFGGVFCDIESLMCDNNNSFWCESGGICRQEQGGNYSCDCPLGFAGDHCNLAGEICGDDELCYNDGICIVDDLNHGSCDCPPEYLGSGNCVLPTPTSPTLKSDVHEVSTYGESESSHWWGALVVAVGVLFSVSLLAVVVTRCQRARQKTSMHGLSQIKHLQAEESGVGFGDDDPFLRANNVPAK